MNTSRRFLLRIPKHFYEQMLEHFRAAIPNECCGLLSGRIVENGAIGEVAAHYPLRNELDSPTEFLSDSREMLAVMKDMRAKGIDVLAVYHSHPASEPIPSKRDLERNFSSSVVNLIIGFTEGKVDVRAWWLAEDSYVAAEWVVVQVGA